MIRLNHKIMLITGPVGSGKSTRLLAWANDKRVGGFITPVKDGRKVLYDPATGLTQTYELHEPDENAVTVGRFQLDKSAFSTGGRLMNDALALRSTWICIDEIGKLELADQGFHQALADFFPKFAAIPEISAVIVVRKQLLDEVIEKYRLNNIDRLNTKI